MPLVHWHALKFKPKHAFYPVTVVSCQSFKIDTNDCGAMLLYMTGIQLDVPNSVANCGHHRIMSRPVLTVLQVFTRKFGLARLCVR